MDTSKAKERIDCTLDLLLQSSVHKASKTDILRYVVGEMDRRDLLKDVCKKNLHPSYSSGIPEFRNSVPPTSMILSQNFQIPENLALEGLAGAMVEAWRIYNRPK